MEAPALLEHFDKQMMLANCGELFLGGSDTTVHALWNTFYLLLTDATLRETVNADRIGALTAFIDETIRPLSVVRIVFALRLRR